VFTIEVLNLVRTPDANVGCTPQYGQIDHAVLLEGVEAGFAYTVNAHDASTSFAAK
jgi:hypothetical protein